MVWMTKAGRSLLLTTLVAAVLVTGPLSGPGGAQELGDPPPAAPGAATQAPAAPGSPAPRHDDGGDVDQAGLLGVMLLLLFLMAPSIRRNRQPACRCPAHLPSHRH